MHKALFISILLCLGYTASAQRVVTRMDSMKMQIYQETNTVFFADWAMKLADAREYNVIERNQLTEWFIDRSASLKFETENAAFKFRKSIAKTITGDYKEALALINEAIPVFKKHNNALWLAACYNSAGGMIAQQGNVAQGIEYLKTAIALAPGYKVSEKLGARALTNHYNSLGNIYANNNQLDSALKYINKSYNLAKKVEGHGSKERCFGQLNLAKIYIKSGDYHLAIQYATKVIEESKINNYEDVKCFGLNRLAAAYEGLEKYDSAFLFYDLALEQTRKYDLKDAETSLLKSKANLALELNQFKTAALNFKEYSKKRDRQIKNNQSASVDYLIKRTQEADDKRSDLEKQQLRAQEEAKQNNLRIVIVGILVGLLLIGTLLFFWYQRKKMNQKLASEKVEKELIKSQIRTINSQMNPHFVFNALNSVQDLIMLKDIRNSNIYLGKFADLMRQTLDYSQQDTISLRKELDTAVLYLDLEKLRFGDEFNFTIDSSLTEDQLEDIEIPSLLLQPYIENAIKHGLLHKKSKKELCIKLRTASDKVTIDILDNGVGRAKSAEINARRKEGYRSFAMQANAQRLALVKESTGKEIILTLSDVEPTGTKVSIEFTL